MEMTLQEYMSTTDYGFKSHVIDMGVSREDTKTYTILFYRDVEEYGGYTLYDQLVVVYVVVSLLNDEILEMSYFDPYEYEMLIQDGIC